MNCKYKYELWFLILKNLQLKYKNTVLGFFWSLLHPFLYLFIFLIIFHNAFPSIENYPLYVISGLVFWLFFSEGTNRLSQVFIKNGHLIKCLNMPKIIYPIAEIGSELFSFSLSLIPFTVLMLFMGLELSVNLLYIIPVIIIFSIFILSVGLILGSLNVFFRDVGILWITLNPALFFVSPIAYSYDIIPAKFNVLISLNPLYHFLVIIRNIIVENRAPVLYNLIICILVTIVLFLLAIFIYQKTRNSFISNL